MGFVLSEAAAADFSPVVHDGFSVSSSDETADQIRENFESEPRPLDGEPVDPEKEEAERVSRAASELGKKGAAALAAKKAEAAAEPEEDDEEPEPGVKAKPGSGNDLRNRMKEATREAADVKRQLAVERQEREKLAEQVKRLSAPAERVQEPAKAAAVDPGKPKLASYENHEDWVEAIADYKADLKIRALQEESARVSTRQRQEMHVQLSEAQKEKRIKETFEAAIKAEPDLHKTLTTSLPPDFFQARSVYGALKTGEPITAKNYIAEGLLKSSHQVEMAKYFAKNPSEYDRVSALKTPDEVVWEMAQVEGMLKHLHNSPPVTATTGSGNTGGASRAKPPVKPVTGSPGTANFSEGSDDESLETHVRRENARDRSRARGELR